MQNALSIRNRRAIADFASIKWGIYHSLNSPQDIQDEILKFANFSIEEVNGLSVKNPEIVKSPLIAVPNPLKNSIQLKNSSFQLENFQLFSLNGRHILDKNIRQKTEIDIYPTFISKGIEQNY